MCKSRGFVRAVVTKCAGKGVESCDSLCVEERMFDFGPTA